MKEHVVSLELWKPVKDYAGFYEVSNLGRVRSIKRKMTKGKIIHQNYRSRYMFVDLSKKGYRRSHSVSRLVASAHIPNLLNKPFVNHKDGNKKNNKVNNLEWVSASENMQHAFDTGLKKPTIGESNGMAKLNSRQVKQIRISYFQGISISRLSDIFCVSQQALSDIIHRRKWKHIT